VSAAELTLSVVDRIGAAQPVRVCAGEVLMPALRDQVDVTIGICGGAISCGTCLVLLDESWAGRLPPPGEDEAEMLEALEALGAEAGGRLACQLKMPVAVAGLRLTVAPEL
jgi:2Fe-2S ferredoxin